MFSGFSGFSGVSGGSEGVKLGGKNSILSEFELSRIYSGLPHDLIIKVRTDTYKTQYKTQKFHRSRLTERMPLL